jgi:hypothetical protein
MALESTLPVPPENSVQPMAEVLPPNKRTAVLQSGETNPAVRTCSRALFGQVISNGKDEQHAARADSRLFQAARRS